MSASLSSRSDRLRGAALAIGVQAAIVYALLTGLAVRMPHVVQQGLKLFAVAPPVPPPPQEKTRPHPVLSTHPEGAAAPPNIRSKATQVVAPVPIVPLPVPPPIPVAVTPGIGADATSGNADIRGPGTGAGGVGNGTGSGRSGDGDGGGGDTPPRLRRGKLKFSDFPEAIGDPDATRPVGVRYTVLANGRVADCAVTRSSGNALLDQVTCRLITQRFVFYPSRDASGRPVESTIVESHGWSSRAAPGDDPAPDDR